MTRELTQLVRHRGEEWRGRHTSTTSQIPSIAAAAVFSGGIISELSFTTCSVFFRPFKITFLVLLALSTIVGLVVGWVSVPIMPTYGLGRVKAESGPVTLPSIVSTLVVSLEIGVDRLSYTVVRFDSSTTFSKWDDLELGRLLIVDTSEELGIGTSIVWEVEGDWAITTCDIKSNPGG